MRPVAVAGNALGVLLVVVFAFFWQEAEKEVRIMCETIQVGGPMGDAVRMLSTGNLLTMRRVDDASFQGIRVTSALTLNASRCDVAVADGVVTETRYRNAWVARLASIVALALVVMGLVGWRRRGVAGSAKAGP